MKIIFFLLLIISFFACSHKENNTPQVSSSSKTNSLNSDTISEVGFKSIIITKDEYRIAESLYKNDLITDTDLHPKKNNTISLPIQNGSNKSNKLFKDERIGMPEGVEFNYIGRFLGPDIYVLNSHYYEWEDFKLIPCDGSPLIEIYGEPKISSNHNYIAYIVNSVYDEDECGFKIIGINSDINYNKTIFTEKCENFQLKWRPIDFLWSENNLLIKATNYTNYDENVQEKDMFYMKIVFL